MKTQLRSVPHSILRDEVIIEIWHNGQFIGTIAGADGPGVRIISKYLTNSADAITIAVEPIPVLEVKLQP